MHIIYEFDKFDVLYWIINIFFIYQ